MVEYVVYFVYFVYSVYFVYFGMVEYSTFCTFCIAMYIELWQNIVHFVLYDDLFKLSCTSPHHLTNILFFLGVFTIFHITPSSFITKCQKKENHLLDITLHPSKPLDSEASGIV